jgi:hypothetical protein
MIVRAIENCLKHARERGWKYTYWAFDIHSTILRPNYKANEIAREFYPHAVEVLQHISAQKNLIMILYTCSYPHEIKQYLDHFEKHGIRFDYVNSNPHVSDGSYGYYKEKFYFNVLMDDKAGFDGETDWKAIRDFFEKNGA